MKLSNNQIKQIAEDLDCGLISFINSDTKEIKSIIDPDDIYAEEEHWKEDLEEIENNWTNYIRIDKMSSREAFEIMEEFTLQIKNIKIQNRLIYALNRRKPFRNFKYEIDCHEDIRQQWFKFKAYKYEEWVKNYLENLDEDVTEKNIEIRKMTGYYSDDGTEYNPDLYPLPNLCLSCKKKDDPNEEIVCNLTRMDQIEEIEFKCFAYQQINK